MEIWDMIGQFGNVWKWQLATFLEDLRIIQAVTHCSCLFWNGLPHDICLLDVSFSWKWVSCANTTHNAFLNSKLFIRWSSHVTKCHNKIANLQESHPNGAHWTISTVMLVFLHKPTPRRPRGVVHINLAGVLPIPWSEITWALTSELFHVSWISLGCSLLGMYPYLGSFIVVSSYGR